MGRGKNRGRRKRREQQQQDGTLRDLSDDQLNDTLTEIEQGSDRVAGIMWAALLENSLEGAIMTCLKDTSDAAKLFDDVRGPYNTFYAKIVAGRAMGLFNANVEKLLHNVRQIRNKFAHSMLSLDFTEKEVAGWCEKLRPFEDKDRGETKLSEPRRLYEDACVHLTCCMISKGTKNIEEQIESMKNKELAEWFEKNREILLRPSKLSDFLHLIPSSAESGGKNFKNHLQVVGGVRDDKPARPSS